MNTCTCHTPDCVNEGLPVELELSYTDPGDGQTYTVGSVVCGACGQEITDVAPPLGAGTEGTTDD